MHTSRFPGLGSLSLLPLLLLLSPCAQGQSESRVQGPVIGYVHDARSGIRPILGVPGAARIGSTLPIRTVFDTVEFPPGRDYALATLARGHRVTMVRNLSAVPRTVWLDVPPGPDRVVFSPSGDAVALYYSGTARVEVLTGLPDSPSVVWGLDLLEKQTLLAALAVSDGGSAILGAWAGEPAPIWLAMPGQGLRYIHTVSASPSLAFLVRSEDALVADGLAGETVLLRNPKGSVQLSRIGGPAEGIVRPVAIAAAGDNRQVLVANARPPGVVTLSLGGSEAVQVSCACQPTAMEKLVSSEIFRLSEPGKGTLWLVQAGSRPRIFFVPDPGQVRRLDRIAVPRSAGGVR